MRRVAPAEEGRSTEKMSGLPVIFSVLRSSVVVVSIVVIITVDLI